MVLISCKERKQGRASLLKIFRGVDSLADQPVLAGGNCGYRRLPTATNALGQSDTAN